MLLFELVFTDLNYMFIYSVSIAPEIWIGLKSTVPECDTKNKWVQWGQINTMWVYHPSITVSPWNLIALTFHWYCPMKICIHQLPLTHCLEDIKFKSKNLVTRKCFIENLQVSKTHLHFWLIDVKSSQIKFTNPWTTLKILYLFD